MAGSDRTRTDPGKKVDAGTEPTQAAPTAGGAGAPVLAPVEGGRYERGRELARGGMGRILAAHDRFLGRPVAIKELIRPDPGLAMRFEREALITARLQHPSIVSLYDAGRWPSGEPFYAMKLVAGRSLKEVIEAAQSFDERLALVPRVIAIAEALAYAHAQHVVHRDLKPANVLVGDFGETVVIDWGLAKDLDSTDPELPPTKVRAGSRSSSELTALGSVMGTPAFMPPEQAEGGLVDQRADVYAIGAILYHVLAGRPPYADSASSKDLLAQVLEGPPTPLTRLAPAAPPDLVAIARRAMARSPEDRYPTARELEEELHRFQTGQLVAAHRYTRAELARRWVRRHRAALLATFSVVVAAAAIGGFSIQRIVSERERAEDAERRAVERADRLTLSEARAAAVRDPLAGLALLSELGPRSPSWGSARVIAAAAIARGVPRILRGPPGRQRVLAVDGARKRIAVGGSDGVVWMWEGEGGAGRELHRHDGAVKALDFDAASGRLVSFGAGTVQVWDPVAGSRRVAGELGNIGQARLAPGGGSIHIVTMAGLLAAEVPAADEPRRIELPELAAVVSHSPDGRYLVVATLGVNGFLLDLRDGKSTMLRGHTEPLAAVAFAPDGRTVATAAADGTVRLWDLRGTALRVLEGHAGQVGDVAFSPDGELLASAGSDHLVKLWTVKTGDSVTLAGHEEIVTGVVFSPGGRWLATTGRDRGVRVWDRAGRPARVLPVENPGAEAAFLDEDTLVTVADGPDVRAWDLSAAAATVFGEHIFDAAVARAGSTVVAVDLGQRVRILDLAGGEPREHVNPDGVVEVVELAPDARTFATLSSGRVRVWDVERGESRALPGYGAEPVVFSPDGRRLAAAGKIRHDVLVWEVASATGKSFSGHGDFVIDLAFSPDGDLLASASRDGTVRLWDLATEEVRVLAGHEGKLLRVAVSPEGRFVASSGEDHTVRLWDLATGETKVVRVDTPSRALAFSPDGRTLAAGDGKALRLYATDGGDDRVFGGHASEIVHVVYSADGRALATADGATVLLWDPASAEARTALSLDDRPELSSVSFSGTTLVVLAERKLHLVRDDLPHDPAALRARIAALLPGTEPRP